jgi:hypothetical protein
MKTVLKILACIGFTFGAAFVSAAKDWRGLVPLHSTRADVEKLLGEPPPPPADGTRTYTLSKARSIYFLDEGEVYIVFAEEEVGAAVECSGKIPSGTVLMIQVTPKKEMTLNELRIDEKRFRKFDPSQPPDIGFMVYVDDEEGMAVRTQDGKVQEIYYIASGADKSLCPSYYENFEASMSIIADIRTLFDEYGNIDFNDEKARLDNFAVQLQNEPKWKGYVIAYGGKRARVGEAKARAERAVNYLINRRGLDADKIEAIDGGYREQSTVELYILPDTLPAPTPTPTVNPNEVQIIYENEKPNGRKRAKP